MGRRRAASGSLENLSLMQRTTRTRSLVPMGRNDVEPQLQRQP